MVLAHGGHLTHGSPVNVSGMWFNFVGYEVDRETEQLDMDRVRDLAKQERPKIILAGYTAYPREIDFAAFRSIADEVGAILWVDASHFIGLVAGGAYPSPVPLRRRRDLHHAQGAARPARRDDPVQGGAREGDRQGGVPDDAGRSARALHRGQGRRAQGGLDARVPRLRGAHRPRRARARGGPGGGGPADRLGRHGLAPDPRRPAAARDRGEDGRGRRRRGGDRPQQEPDPLRPEPAVRTLGHPGGHARRVDARHGRARDARGRRASWARCSRARTTPA